MLWRWLTCLEKPDYTPGSHLPDVHISNKYAFIVILWQDVHGTRPPPLVRAHTNTDSPSI